MLLAQQAETITLVHPSTTNVRIHTIMMWPEGWITHRPLYKLLIHINLYIMLDLESERIDLTVTSKYRQNRGGSCEITLGLRISNLHWRDCWRCERKIFLPIITVLFQWEEKVLRMYSFHLPYHSASKF